MPPPQSTPSALPDSVGIVGIVGLVGLGLVGLALHARLQAQGVRTLGHDRDATAMARYAAAGGQPVASLPALGRQVDSVLLAVFDTAGVLAVVEDPLHGLLAAPPPAVARPGHAPQALRRIVDCSTGDPGPLQALGERLAARGIDFIESPLSGSSQQIAAGEATALVGAQPAAWQAAQPLLALLAGRCIHIGAPGMGATAKLATNLVLGLNRAVLAEGLVFAQALGIAPEAFLQLVLATPAKSDAASIKGPRMVSGDFTAPQSRIHQHLKDVQLMLANARQAGVALPFSSVHAELLRQAVADGHGELDNAAIVLTLRDRKP